VATILPPDPTRAKPDAISARQKTAFFL